jgi:hypothetical protein
MVSFNSYFSQNCPRDIRATMTGLLKLFSLFGDAIIFFVGGKIFNISSYLPFYVVAIFDAGYGIFVLIMVFCDKFQKPVTLSEKEIEYLIDE